IDRQGNDVGHGAYTRSPGLVYYGQIFPSAGGIAWAWSTLDSEPGTGPWTSSVWTASPGSLPRKVKRFSEPNGTEIHVRQWSDSGIVLLKVLVACGGGNAMSTTLLNPATAAERQIFGSGVLPMDVQTGVRAGLNLAQNSVTVVGAASWTYRYALPVYQARVNP